MKCPEQKKTPIFFGHSKIYNFNISVGFLGVVGFLMKKEPQLVAVRN